MSNPGRGKGSSYVGPLSGGLVGGTVTTQKNRVNPPWAKVFRVPFCYGLNVSGPKFLCGGNSPNGLVGGIWWCLVIRTLGGYS